MMSGVSKVLIGGGSGFLGWRLCTKLKLEGFEPMIISRTATGKKSRITWNDLYRVGLPENCKAVVNLAGENVGNPLKRYNDDFKHKLYDSRIETTKQIVEAIKRSDNPPEVFIGGSAIGYYKPDESARYTEASPGGDHDFMSRMVNDWEKAAEGVAEKGVRHVTIRIGLALGREGGMIKSLYFPFFFGMGGVIGSGQQWTPWIHADDLIGIILHSIRNKDVHGILNGVAPNCVRNKEFVEAFAKAMSRPAFVPTPVVALNAIFGKERAEMMTTGAYVVPERTLESGYKFQYETIEEACKEVSRLAPHPSLYRNDL